MTTKMKEHSDKHEPCWHRTNEAPFFSITQRWKERCCRCGEEQMVMEKRTESPNGKHGKYLPRISMFWAGE